MFIVKILAQNTYNQNNCRYSGNRFSGWNIDKDFIPLSLNAWVFTKILSSLKKLLIHLLRFRSRIIINSKISHKISAKINYIPAKKI